MAIVLAVLVAISGTAAAQQIPKKAIPSAFTSGGKTDCSPCSFGVNVWWHEPAKRPDAYKVRWAIDGKYVKKGVRKRAGAVRIEEAEARGRGHSYRIDSVRMEIGDRLYVQIRALYKGRKAGPWTSPMVLHFEGRGAGKKWRVREVHHGGSDKQGQKRGGKEEGSWLVRCWI